MLRGEQGSAFTLNSVHCTLYELERFVDNNKTSQLNHLLLSWYNGKHRETSLNRYNVVS